MARLAGCDLEMVRAEFTQLGSGLSLAQRDLEIRGAGSLLGSDQVPLSPFSSGCARDLNVSELGEAWLFLPCLYQT